MESYIGNTLNINNSSESLIPASLLFDTDDVKKAQGILKDIDDKATSEQLKVLSQRLFNSSIESYLTDGEYIKNAASVVFDWNSEVRNVSFANVKNDLRRLHLMKNLLNWQKQLLNLISKEKETCSIHIFEKNGTKSLWVIVDDPSIDTILRYSEIYMNYLDENNNALCDFMVFGKEEVNYTSLPIGTYSYFCEE